MSKRYTANVIEDDNGDAIIPLPPELLKEVGWKEGDVLSWKDNGDGSFALTKRERMRQLVLVETISTFRHRYVVEVPVGKRDWALDAIVCDIVCDEAIELSQKHLEEIIVSHRVISNEEMMEIHREDNDYLSSWDAEKVYSSLVTKIDDAGNLVKE